MNEFAADCETVIEYACAMHGRAQIYFSRGLREWAGLVAGKDGQGLTDEQLCDEMTDHGIVIGGFSRAQHKFIRKKIAWKNIKTAIEKHGPSVLNVISKWLEKNGLGRVISAEKAKLYETMREGVNASDDFDFASFDELIAELKTMNNGTCPDDSTMGESVRELAAKETEELNKPVQTSLDFSGGFGAVADG